MKGIITKKGSRRFRIVNGKNKIVDVISVRVMPWGSAMAKFLHPTTGNLCECHAYSPGHGKDCAIILQR